MRTTLKVLACIFLFPLFLFANRLDDKFADENDDILTLFYTNEPQTSRELTIEEAISLAMQNNIGLKNGQLDLQYKQFAKDSSWNVFLPSLSTSVGLMRSNKEIKVPPSLNEQKESAESQRWSLKMGLNFQFMLSPTAFRRMYQAFLDYDNQKISFEKLKRQTYRDVSRLFYQILALEKSFSNLQMQIKNAEGRYKQALLNYKNGLVNDLTVLQAEVAYESLKPNLDLAKTDWEVMSMNLKTFLGLPLNQNIRLVGDIAVEYFNLDEHALILSVSETLDMQELALGIKTLDNSFKAQLDALFPAFTIAYSWAGPSTKGLGGSQGVLHPFSKGSWDKSKLEWDNGALTLALNWNLDSFLPWSKAGVNRHQAKVESQKLTNSYSQALKNRIFDLKSKLTKLKAYASTIEARKFALELAQKSYSQLDLAHKSGMVELLELQNAAVKMSSAEIDLLNAQINYVDTILELEYITGRSLKDFCLK